MKRRALLAAGVAFPVAALAKGGPRGSDPDRSAWFANQKNMTGGSCCWLGDGHELDPDDVRYDADTGLWSVRLPYPSVETFGEDSLDARGKAKIWYEVPGVRMRDQAGGPPPHIANPIVWYDTSTHAHASVAGTPMGDEAGSKPYLIVYCLEPNPQF
jgi:hypothetical protein